MSFPRPMYPTRRADGVDVDLRGLEHEVPRYPTAIDILTAMPPPAVAIVLAPEGVRHERSWCVRDWGQSTPHLAVVLPHTRGGWDWKVDGGPQGHDPELLRAMLFAEAAVHVVDLERQAEGLGPSRPGPLYLLAARLIRNAIEETKAYRDVIGETKAYREALLWTMPDDSPKARAAAWAYEIASWPEDGLCQDVDGRQRDPFDVLAWGAFDVLAWGASWPRNEGPPPWYDLASVIVLAARPDVVRDEERRQIVHPAAVWARVEAALAEYLPKLVSSRQW